MIYPFQSYSHYCGKFCIYTHLVDSKFTTGQNTEEVFFLLKKNFYRKQVNVLDISPTPTNGRSLVHYNPIALCL